MEPAPVHWDVGSTNLILKHRKLGFLGFFPNLQRVGYDIAHPQISTKVHNMQLNTDQQKAADTIFSFLVSSKRELIISGPGGTGKTTLMKYIKDILMDKYENSCRILNMTPMIHTVAYTATTNKAAEVLRDATNEDASTIHSFLSLKVRNNYRTGKSVISKTDGTVVHSNLLLFIDEGSMLDREMLEIIREQLDHTCKIIYIADHCQLPAIFETESAIFQNPDYFCELTQPIRNAGQPALVEMCAMFREFVESKGQSPLEVFLEPGVIEYIPDEAGLQKFIHASFKDEGVENRILCYTNKRVKMYNEYIRTFRGYGPTFEKDELVVNNTAINVSRKIRLKVEQQFIIGDTKKRFQVQADNNDPTSTFTVINIDIEAVRGGPIITVQVPEDYDRFDYLVQHYRKNKQFRIMYALLETYPDLRKMDAATIYKAQGSTYKTVLIDMDDVALCQNAEQLRKLLYVGATRPKERIVFYGETFRDHIFTR